MQCYNPELHHKDVFVCLGTLAMGDALAVEIAQQSHVNVLRELAHCMQPHECLLYRQPVPRGPFFELLTIDDHIGLEKVKRDGSQAELHSRDTQVFEAANEAYKRVKLTAHPGKMRRRAEQAVVLGAEVHGTIGRCSAPRACCSAQFHHLHRCSQKTCHSKVASRVDRMLDACITFQKTAFRSA